MSPWLQLGIAAVAGFVVGGVAAWLVRSRSSAVLAERLREREARIARLETDILAVRQEAAQMQREIQGVREALARAEADLRNERQAAAEKLGLLERGEAKLREAFQALAADALRSNNQSFLDLARATLGEFQKGAKVDLETREKAVAELVSPVRESLKQVDAKLQAIEKEREGAYRALRQQVETMSSTQEKLKAETANLVQALRAPSVRGRWGEIHLRRVVELAGMQEHCDFEEQASVETENGRLRPDLVVHLPGGKHVIVDAKTPLKAYLEAQQETDEAAREAKLVEYARQVREQVTRLGSKAYWDQFESAPDFVVMYIPGEAFFSAALERDRELQEYAFSKRVLPTSPTNLVALLQSVCYGWQQEKVAESAEKIRDLGKELYERLRVMAEHLSRLGTHLDRAVEAFDDVGGSFEHRVLVAARRFKEMGAGSSKELPEIEPIGRSARAIEAGESDDVTDGPDESPVETELVEEPLPPVAPEATRRGRSPDDDRH